MRPIMYLIKKPILVCKTFSLKFKFHATVAFKLENVSNQKAISAYIPKWNLTDIGKYFSL